MLDLCITKQTTKTYGDRALCPAPEAHAPQRLGPSSVLAALGPERAHQAFQRELLTPPGSPRPCVAGGGRVWPAGPNLSQALLAGGCVVGAWVCGRLARVLPVWMGPAATVVILCVGVAYVVYTAEDSAEAPPSPRPRASARASDAEAPQTTQPTRSSRAAFSPPAYAAHAAPRPVPDASLQSPERALGDSAPCTQACTAPLLALMTARLEQDTDLLHRVSAWAQACDVSAGAPHALAYRPAAPEQDPVSQRAQAHQQQVILAASVQSFSRMLPSRRNAFAQQFALLVQRHAACLDDCYAMLASPDEADAIARRIVCPTEAWLEHEAAIERATQAGAHDAFEPSVWQRLYDAPPARYHMAPEVQPETLAAYYKAEAGRLAAAMVRIFTDIEHDLAVEFDEVPVASDDAARLDAWLHAIDVNDCRQAWQPFWGQGYVGIGAFPVAQTPPALASSDDMVGRLEARKARYAMRDAAESAEADDFARQLFAEPPELASRVPMLIQRDTEGCSVQAFLLANMQQLPGAPGTERGRSHRRHAPRASQPSAQAHSSSAAPSIEKMSRACDESWAMLEDGKRHGMALHAALAKPNTSRHHAEVSHRLSRLNAWGKQERARYEHLRQDLRAAQWQAHGDATL